VIDIGGGSTEFIVGQGTEAMLLRSLKLGAIRLTDRFFAKEPPKEKSVRDCRLYVRSLLSAVAHDIDALTESLDRTAGEAPIELAIGCSGTLEAVVRVAATLASGDVPESIANISATAAEVHAATEALIAVSPDERMELGIDKRRVDLIVAGAVLADEIMSRLKIESITISEYALREGLLMDRCQDSHQGLHHLTNLRRSSVVGLAERYHQDLSRIAWINERTLELFDATTELHKLSALDRELLDAAGLLHNIGLFVSHAAHHKHSQYLIENSESLAGFTEAEIAIVANVARYHRKSAPKDKHVSFSALSGVDQDRVRKMAGLLRIAIALDRTRAGAVERVSASFDNASEELTVTLHPASGADISLEKYTAQERSGLLAGALGVDVRIESV